MQFKPIEFDMQDLLGCSFTGFYAYAGKYSFLIIRENHGGWKTSWQDQEKGGSASNTTEGPFKTLQAAEANCRRIFKELQQKN